MVFYGWKVGEWTEWTAERGVFWGMVVVEVEVVVVKVCQWFGWRRWRWGTLNTKHKTHKTVSFSQRDTARKVAETERESREKSLCVNFNFFFFFFAVDLWKATLWSKPCTPVGTAKVKWSVQTCVCDRWREQRRRRSIIMTVNIWHGKQTSEWVNIYRPFTGCVFLVEVQAGRWTANVAQTKHFSHLFCDIRDVMKSESVLREAGEEEWSFSGWSSSQCVTHAQ